MSTIERPRRKRCLPLQASAAPSPCNNLKRLLWLRRLGARACRYVQEMKRVTRLNDYWF